MKHSAPALSPTRSFRNFHGHAVEVTLHADSPEDLFSASAPGANYPRPTRPYLIWCAFAATLPPAPFHADDVDGSEDPRTNDAGDALLPLWFLAERDEESAPIFATPADGWGEFRAQWMFLVEQGLLSEDCPRMLGLSSAIIDAEQALEVE